MRLSLLFGRSLVIVGLSAGLLGAGLAAPAGAAVVTPDCVGIGTSVSSADSTAADTLVTVTAEFASHPESVALGVGTDAGDGIDVRTQSFTVASGVLVNGTVRVPRHLPAGDYLVYVASVTTGLEGGGAICAAPLTVTSSSPDTTPPTGAVATVLTSAVDLDRVTASAQLQVTAQDDLSGVASVGLELQGPTAASKLFVCTFRDLTCSTSGSRSSLGSRNADGSWLFTVPAASLTDGVWTVTSIYTEDDAGNGSSVAPGVPVTFLAGRRPTAPTGVTVTSLDSALSVSWQAPANSTGLTGYRIETVPATAALDVPMTATTAVLGGLTNGTRYSVLVEALSALGSSGATRGAVPEGVPVAPLAAPQDIVLTGAGTDRLGLLRFAASWRFAPGTDRVDVQSVVVGASQAAVVGPVTLDAAGVTHTTVTVSPGTTALILTARTARLGYVTMSPPVRIELGSSRIAGRPTTRRSVVAGARVPLTATLTDPVTGSPLAGRPVTFVFASLSSAARSERVVARATTDAAGRATSSVRALLSGYFTMRFAGENARSGSVSTAANVRITPTVGLLLTRKQAAVGTKVTVRGQVLGADTGTTAVLQKRVGRTWRKVVALRLVKGRYAAKVGVTAGPTAYRVVVPRTRFHNAAVSRPIVLTGSVRG